MEKRNPSLLWLFQSDKNPRVWAGAHNKIWGGGILGEKPRDSLGRVVPKLNVVTAPIFHGGSSSQLPQEPPSWTAWDLAWSKMAAPRRTKKMGATTLNWARSWVILAKSLVIQDGRTWKTWKKRLSGTSFGILVSRVLEPLPKMHKERLRGAEAFICVLLVIAELPVFIHSEGIGPDGKG